MSEVSTVRVYVLRFVYFLNFAGLSFMAWPAVVGPRTHWV